MIAIDHDLMARAIIAHKLGGALFGNSPSWANDVFPSATFGDAVVVGVPFYAWDGARKLAYAVCRCRCGMPVLATVSKLLRDGNCSCGCERHRATGTRLYRIWRNVKTRCRNPNNRYYANYGARGIDICAEWADDFRAFQAWAEANGYADGLTLDRKSNELGYGPNNCHWVSYTQQANNRRNTVTLTAFGETKPLGDWARDPRCVVSRDVLYGRARRRAMTPEEMLTRPMKGRE